jgi:hypothetical protein
MLVFPPPFRFLFNELRLSDLLLSEYPLPESSSLSIIPLVLTKCTQASQSDVLESTLEAVPY